MTGVSYDAALLAVRARLTPASAAHCEAVAQQAAFIAAQYDVDVEAARLGGLLHDWARDVDKGELLDMALKRGIVSDAVGDKVPYLLHAQIGAILIAEEFPGILDEILTAVERHTTGAPDMTELDIVVYVADMTEPARSFPGVQDLRDAIGEVPISELFARAYETSMHHLLERRRRLAPGTVHVWNGIVDRELS
ncbi:MAG: bis(5'-nucleosyl)-tetraphosphatase (symmetrical) YqeK [Coriobacteriia bacterium]